MTEGSLGINEIELVINSKKELNDGSRVRDHTACSYNLGKITT